MAATAAAVAEQHDESFEALYREHAPTVYRYALGTVGNPADAEDVAQSTFTAALRALRRGVRPEKPENWLISIAHNECRQRFRRLGRRASEVPLDTELASAESGVADAAETTETIGDVLDALSELPFNQRAALVLREVSGRSAAEIAECLGTSVAAVDMLVFRARQSIRTNVAGVRALALVPLPRSLLSFLGGSAAGTGAVAAGAGLAVKLAAVAIAAVAVATTGGSTPVDAAGPAEPAVAQTPERDAPERVRASAASVRAPESTPGRAPGEASAHPARNAQAVELGSARSAPLPVTPPALTAPALPLPPVLSESAVGRPSVSLPAVPQLPQLPPGLPEDVDVPAPVTEGIPNPGVTLPDAGTRTLP